MKSKYDICHTLLHDLNTHFNMHACVVRHYQAHTTSAHMHRSRSWGFCDVGCAHTFATAVILQKSVSGLHAHPRESPTMLKVKEKHWVSSCLLSECYIARSDYAAQHSARRNCVQLAKNLPKLHQGCRRPQKSNCETPQGPSDWRSESAARPRNTLVHLPS